MPFIADAAFRHRFRQRHLAPLETGEPYGVPNKREREREKKGVEEDVRDSSRARCRDRDVMLDSLTR